MNTALEIHWCHFENTPSRKDGISEHVEKYLRAETCRFIDKFGKKESLTGKIRLLACSLFHIFYLRASFKQIPRYEVAVACLCIAAKIENKVQHLRDLSKRAALYLRPKLMERLSEPQQKLQNYHWTAQIHIRERQIIERLHGELRIHLPILFLKLPELREIIINKNGRTFTSDKNRNLSQIFKGCFEIFRKIFRSVLCIYYPPPWIAAVALFKSIKKYNRDRLIRIQQQQQQEQQQNAAANNNNNNNGGNATNEKNKIGPKLYLAEGWYLKFDEIMKKLDLNTIQYISDEVDACDEETVSVKDYITRPAEFCGAKDTACIKRVNLIRTTPFQCLPVQIQQDLQHCFKLQNHEFIDLRSEHIKRLDAENRALKQSKAGGSDENHSHSNSNQTTSPSKDGANVSTDWVVGPGPSQMDTIRQLMKENRKLRKRKNTNLEEGEIEDEDVDDVHANNNKQHGLKRKRFGGDDYSNKSSTSSARKRSTSKSFQTEKYKQSHMNAKENHFHCGLERYKYTKKSNTNHNRKQKNIDVTDPEQAPAVDVDDDAYYMNWCSQSFEWDEKGECISTQPEIQSQDTVQVNEESTTYRIPTPNYIPSGNTPYNLDELTSPITPGYGISPMGPPSDGASLTPQQPVSMPKATEDEAPAYWQRSYAEKEDEVNLGNSSLLDLNDSQVVMNSNTNSNSNSNSNSNVNNNSNHTNNTHSFTTRSSKRNSYSGYNGYDDSSEPPYKKMKPNQR